MKFPFSRRFKISLFIILSLPLNCNLSQLLVNDYKADIVISWNEKIMEIAVAEDGLLTLKGVRTVSMMHVAIHDVINTIVPEYSRYAYTGEIIDVDPVAAAAFTAYEIASNQYPENEEELKSELQKWIGQKRDEKEIVTAKKLGKLCATAVLEKRSGDNWNGEAKYTWHPMAPGVYAEFNEHSGTPKGFIFGAGWAKAEPFLLPTQNFLRSPPPPDINSKEYTEAFNEVKESSRFESISRTSDQTHLALWWKDFVENSHNRLARHLVKIEELNLWEASRAFALMNMAIFDAYVSVFDNKFFYNHWRPYTAIRWAEHDGNPNTEPELNWDNLHRHTYAFPSYPSAHGCASAAAMKVLSFTLGVRDKYFFTMTTEEVDKAGPFSGKIKMNPSTRTFNSFSEAAFEASMSRVYLGIHSRYDSVEGFKLGQKIGEYANQNFLRPIAKVE
jgi:hypothetical protein